MDVNVINVLIDSCHVFFTTSISFQIFLTHQMIFSRAHALFIHICNLNTSALRGGQKHVKEIISINSLFLMYCMLPLRSRIASSNFLQIFMINQMFMIKLLKSLTIHKRILHVCIQLTFRATKRFCFVPRLGGLGLDPFFNSFIVFFSFSIL